jgi:hypothetical protein
MNERIKELVGQAKFIAEESINKQISSNQELNAFAEKFAQLIVEECAHIVENSPWRFKHGYKAIDQANLLKQHFGVE